MMAGRLTWVAQAGCELGVEGPCVRVVELLDHRVPEQRVAELDAPSSLYRDARRDELRVPVSEHRGRKRSPRECEKAGGFPCRGGERTQACREGDLEAGAQIIRRGEL